MNKASLLIPRTPARLALLSLSAFFLIYLVRLVYMLHLQGRGCVAVLDVVSCENALPTGTFLYEGLYMALYYAQMIGEIVVVFAVVGSVLWYIVQQIQAYRSGTAPRGLMKALSMIVLCIVLVGGMIYTAYKQAATEAVSKHDADAIRLIRITQADVDGSILPPMPDPSVRDSTIAGVDQNNNTIRDDVEVAIFKEYKQFRDRAAALQYAQAMQVLLTKVNSKETMRAALEKRSSAVQCLDVDEARMRKVEIVQLNTEERENMEEETFEKYMTSHGDSGGVDCMYETF